MALVKVKSGRRRWELNPRSGCSAIGSIRERDHLEKISKFLVDILLLEPKFFYTTVRSVGVRIETMSAS